MVPASSSFGRNTACFVAVEGSLQYIVSHNKMEKVSALFSKGSVSLSGDGICSVIDSMTEI